MPANAILERHEYDAASSACVSNAWNVALLDERRPWQHFRQPICNVFFSGHMFQTDVAQLEQVSQHPVPNPA
jgi:hypothetical protein